MGNNNSGDGEKEDDTAGNEEKKEQNQEENIAADTVKYSQRLLQKKEALLKRIAKLQKQCEE